MARNSTIFGPNESSRRDLFLEKFSKERNEQKVFEKFKNFSNFFFEKIFIGFFLGNIKDSSLVKLSCGSFPYAAPEVVDAYKHKVSETKKAPKLNFLGKFCRQKSLLKFWPMGGQKKV